MSNSEILKGAPMYIVKRYNSFNFYIWETLFPNDYRRRVLLKFKSKELRKEEFKKMKGIVDEATLLVFIFVLRKFFFEGSRMAKDTVDELRTFGVNGFNLGKSFFSDRNENVLIGDRLAEKLFSLLDSKTKKLLSDKQYIYEILDNYSSLKKEMYG